jgi:hypothetical protein
MLLFSSCAHEEFDNIDCALESEVNRRQFIDELDTADERID